MLRVRVALQSIHFRTFLGQNSARMNKIRSARTNLRTVGAPDSMIHRSKSPYEPVPASPKLDPLQHRAVMSLQTRRPPGHASLSRCVVCRHGLLAGHAQGQPQADCPADCRVQSCKRGCVPTGLPQRLRQRSPNPDRRRNAHSLSALKKRSFEAVQIDADAIT